MGPDGEVDGKKVNVIVATMKELSRGMTLSFDKTTGKLVKKVRKVSEADEETFYHDYKEVDGVQVSMKQIAYRDGKKYVTSKTTRYKFLTKVDDSLFNEDN